MAPGGASRLTAAWGAPLKCADSLDAGLDGTGGLPLGRGGDRLLHPRVRRVHQGHLLGRHAHEPAELARMREANEASGRDPKAATAIYDALAADGSIGPAFQDLAALRAGYLLVDTAPFADGQKRLEQIGRAHV